MHRVRTLHFTGPMLGLALLIAACGGGNGDGASSGDGDELTMRLGFFLTGHRMPYVYALEEGFYEDEGLNVTILEGEGTVSNAQLVANGDILIGEGDVATVASLRKQGIELKVIGVFGQQTPMAIVGWQSHGISQPSDLESKKLGVTPGEAPLLVLPGFLSAEEVDRSSIREIPLEPANKFTVFQNEEVDAITTFVTSLPPPYFAAENDFALFRYADAGMALLSDGLFVTAESLEERDDTLRRFLRAVVKAFEECDADPEHCAQVSAQFKDTADPDLLVDQWEMGRPLWYTENTEGGQVGVTSEEDWTATLGTLVQFDLLDEAPDPSEIYTNDLLPTP